MSETLYQPSWKMEERGWWSCSRGGICKENDGWYIYPAAFNMNSCYGPWRTKREAMDAAPEIFSREEHRTDYW